MRFTMPAVEIEETEGFGDRDIFGHAKFADGLTNVLLQSSEPLVLALDGKWGTGKTVFLKMWAGELRKAGVPVVYFDAFENDYLDDAFLSIAGQIFKLIEEHRVEKTPAAEKYVNRAKQVGKVVVRTGLKIGVKAATLGAFSSSDQDEAVNQVAEAANKDLSNEMANLFDKYVGEMITGQAAQSALIQQFRTDLSDLPSVLRDNKSPKSDEKENGKPLVFIIDELDRCKPPFALDLMERMKHFFNVNNLHFILGCNIDQLCGSVLSVYGPNIDALTYLRKFIQFSFRLPERKDTYSPPNSRQYVQRVRDQLGLEGKFAVEMSTCIEFLSAHLELDLRTIERVMTVAALISALRPDLDPVFAGLLAGLCVLKVTEPKLYSDIKSGKWHYKAVEEKLLLKNVPEKEGDYELDWMKKSWLYFAESSELNEDDLVVMQRSFARHIRFGPKAMFADLANSIFDRFRET